MKQKDNIIFSLLLPIRNCEGTFKIMIDSVFSTACNSKRIEILLAIDDDDEVSLKVAKEVQSSYSKEGIHFYIRPRSNSLANHYFNWLANNFSNGKYLFVVNHDCLFESKNWDIKSYEKLERFLEYKRDRIVLGIVEDKEDMSGESNLHPFTCFPIFSREILKALGFIFDPRILRWNSEKDIINLYYSVDRVVDLRDVCIIEHKPKEFNKFVNETKERITLKEWKNKKTFKVWMDRRPISKKYEIERFSKLSEYIEKYNAG